MKKLIYFILIGMFSCENPGKQEATPPVTEENYSWNTYEGRVPLDDESRLYITLSMLPANEIGDGIFEMEEYVETGNTSSPVSAFKGKYSTLYGETPEERVVQFHNTAHPEGLKRSYVVPGFRGDVTDSRLSMIREELFRDTDLTVKIDGKNKLLLLDDRMQTVSREPEHNLVRRTSKPFTLEGYFRHNGDSANFFEMNTEENWAVSKYGDYGKAIRQYHQLTKKKFDVTYLKGIGFSIRHVDGEGREIDALVIKKVLQMTSAPAMNGH